METDLTNDQKSAEKRVLLAGAETPFRMSLAEALRDDGHEVHITESGRELLGVLLDIFGEQQKKAGVDAVIIGQGLFEPSGPDSVFLAWRGRQNRNRGQARPAVPVVMVTEVRRDHQQLELLRERGVSVFIYANDNIEDTLATLSQAFFSVERTSPRHSIKLNLELSVQGETIRGESQDLSLTGVKVIVPVGDFPFMPSAGMRLEVWFPEPFLEERLSCAAHVRWVKRQRKTFHDVYALGLQLETKDQAFNEALEAALNRLEEQSMAEAITIGATSLFPSW